MEWYEKKFLDFELPDETYTKDEPFELIKVPNDKKYDYVYDFFEDYLDVINKYQVVALFSKKDMGKSFVGYLWARDYFKQNLGNMLYGRIQEKEKQNARSELFSIFEKFKMNPYYQHNYSRDYIFFQGTEYSCRLVNISSYQSLRGAIGENNNFIWFDEINAHQFPQNFESDFINIISTLGRKNNFKLFLSGNNETAINNPVLNALQLKFDWNYNGIQIATRCVQGVRVMGIQLGYEAFKTKKISIAERLAKFNPSTYNTYYLGLSNTNDCNRIINLKEDYTITKTLFYWADGSSIYSFNQGVINDKVNHYNTKQGFLIKNEPFNYGSNHFNSKIKMYTVSPASDLIFKKAILLFDEDKIVNLFKPFLLAMKNEQLYFCDFDSNDKFMELFTQFHYVRQLIGKDQFNDERRQ